MSNIDARPGRRIPNRAETKPFYLTSEFMVTAAMVISLFIASMVVDDVDARLAWILGVSLVGAYVLSRGIAKSGTSSHAYDPRDELRPEGSRDQPLARERQTTR